MVELNHVHEYVVDEVFVDDLQGLAGVEVGGEELRVVVVGFLKFLAADVDGGVDYVDGFQEPLDVYYSLRIRHFEFGAEYLVAFFYEVAIVRDRRGIGVGRCGGGGDSIAHRPARVEADGILRPHPVRKKPDGVRDDVFVREVGAVVDLYPFAVYFPLEFVGYFVSVWVGRRRPRDLYSVAVVGARRRGYSRRRVRRGFNGNLNRRALDGLAIDAGTVGVLFRGFRL